MKIRYAVVTGASSGVGLSVAKKLANEGYSIVAISRSEPKGFSLHKWLQWDLSNPSLLTQDILRRELPKADVFIGNAGVLYGIPPEEYDLESIQAMLNIHITSQVLLANHLLSQMVAERFGRVVFIGSTAATTGHPDIMYAATKAAISSLTKSYAHLYKNHDITVNCIEAGAMKTAITKSISDKHRQFLGEHTVIGTPYLEIDKVTTLVTNLIADSNQINGSCLTIGQNALWR
jgi:3-oxoacyl-[acyl-carrier protein] reductase